MPFATKSKTYGYDTVQPATTAGFRVQGVNYGTPAPQSSMLNYGLPQGQGGQGAYGGYGTGGTNGSIYNSQDAEYIRNLPTGYTPDQELAMRNRIRSTDTAQNAGGMSRMRDLMASQGLGGSGAEAAALGGLLRGQNATRQGALSNLDISNARTDLANRYGKAGLLNQLMGTGLEENRLGEQGRQFDTSQYNDMYRWSNEADYNRYLDTQSRNDYQSQLQMMLKQLGLSGGSQVDRTVDGAVEKGRS